MGEHEESFCFSKQYEKKQIFSEEQEQAIRAYVQENTSSKKLQKFYKSNLQLFSDVKFESVYSKAYILLKAKQNEKVIQEVNSCTTVE